jgi:hypothetical protein
MIHPNRTYLKSAASFWTRFCATACFAAAATFMLVSLSQAQNTQLQISKPLLSANPS